MNEKLLGQKDSRTLTNLNLLASVLRDQKKYKTAEEMSRRALKGREKILKTEHLDIFTSVSNLASVL